MSVLILNIEFINRYFFYELLIRYKLGSGILFAGKIIFDGDLLGKNSETESIWNVGWRYNRVDDYHSDKGRDDDTMSVWCLHIYRVFASFIYEYLWLLTFNFVLINMLKGTMHACMFLNLSINSLREVNGY